MQKKKFFFVLYLYIIWVEMNILVLILINFLYKKLEFSSWHKYYLKVE